MTNIAAGLQDLTLAIDEPVLHPQNYRQGDVANIAASLSRFGQVRPIVVQASSGHVVAGNHTLMAARSLGWDQIAAVVVDLSDEEAEAYLVADNRASDKATNDDAALAPILERLMLAGRLEGTGYSPDDVDDMLATLDALPEVDAPDFEGAPAVADEQLAERFANRSQVALRQFVLMYDQDTASEVEGYFRQLERAWGMSGARDVVLESLRRTVQTLDGVEAQAAAAQAAEDLVAADPEAPVEQPGDATRIPVADAAGEPAVTATADTPGGPVDLGRWTATEPEEGTLDDPELDLTGGTEAPRNTGAQVTAIGDALTPTTPTSGVQPQPPEALRGDLTADPGDDQPPVPPAA